ncbi:hypothetical protein L207DRAFT_166008 [Hyaloscypha variabilis F]|uniref:Aflatoxin regulatory protein domain-containing protein n=1 Tax=Hyaloscypha variabilis (strain UAMH 11265 / GT02V1 / F) TaxID=1149755 RepID=A0A2J6SAX4_HYAVF|nr:hypothetical protein L207DRAFT_166008 [Hyaloscypha variabilis F]
MASTDFTSSQASSLTTPWPSQDWPDIFATLTLPATTTSPTEHTTSADWASLGSSIDPFTYLDYPAFDFSTPLSSFEQNNPLNGEKVVNPTIFSDNATTSTNNNTISSFTKSNGSLTKDNPPFPTGTQTDTRFSSSSSSPLDRHNSTAFSLVPPCRCLMRTLGFLAQLSMDSSKAGIASENCNALTHQPNVTHVYAQIDNISAEIGKVLQCACSNNADLLVLLLLVISKIQVWYAAAVNAVTSHDNDSEAMDGADSNPTSFHPRIVLPSLEIHLDGDESKGEEQRRVFVQSVLARLTGLQMIVSRLSQRSANIEAVTFPGTMLTPGAQGPLHSDIKGKISVLPFSAIMLRALCSDLRDRLRAIASYCREASC